MWVDPANISTNTLPPPVLIRSVRANGRQAGSLTNLALPPRTTDLQIGYTALSLSVPEKVRFRYRLEEVDKDWQDAGTRREAFYTRLGPGKYHFRVIACNNDGVWNEEGAHLDFNIAPAWYQTIWFRWFYVLRFLHAALGLYQMRSSPVAGAGEEISRRHRDHAGDGCRCDPRVTAQFMNQGWLEYTGIAVGRSVGVGSGTRRVHPDDLERVNDDGASFADEWRTVRG